MEKLPALASLFDLTGKVAIVTGGAKGIGEGIGLRLAEAGAAVVIADLDLEAGNALAARIAADGGRATAVRANVANAAEASGIVDAAVKSFGGLDILVNNAGIFPFAPLLAITEELWNRVLAINLSGAFFVSQAAAKAMIAGGKGGKIINIASIDALHPTGALVHYDASKGGMVMMTRSLALELAPHKILVNAIAPGGVATPGVEAATQGAIHANDGTASGGPRVPLGRMGVPDDIAKVALFLASAAADYVTGELIVVDGGYLLS